MSIHPMKVVCILCDQVFIPDPLTEKKIKKYPHRIQICPSCYERITLQVQSRQEKKNRDSSSNNEMD